MMRKITPCIFALLGFSIVSGFQQPANATDSPPSVSQESTTQPADAAAPGNATPPADNEQSEQSPTAADGTPDGDAGSDDPTLANHDDQDQHGPGPGAGRGRGQGFRGGRGPGGGQLGGFRADMTTIHSMFDDRNKIRRTVKLLPDGAEALTESDDQKITELIQDHVPNMDSRVLGNQPLPPMTFHPVFVGLIKNADKYTLDYEDTDKGVKATYRSDDPYVVMLVQEHAKLVSRFIKNGHAEIHADYDLPEFQAETAAARAKALTARGALFEKLSGRLTEAMKTKGPAAAIEVCSQQASQIAAAVGNQYGVKIGRTAVKLRNEKNQPPSWAESLIKKSPTHGLFVDLPDDQLGALLPIRLQSKCVICHGPSDKIADEVSATLTKFYPNDQATGFGEGDLRGWFWVEVPVK